MVKDAYVRDTYNGKVVNRRTRAILMELSTQLYGSPFELTLLQGSYNPGVSQSGGTHDGGGAVDLSPNDWNDKVHELRGGFGGAAWHRLPSEGDWGEHIHVVFKGDKELAPAARTQVHEYADGENGLADHGPDTFTFHPELVAFDYYAWRRKQRRIARYRMNLTGAIKRLVQARANADGVVARRALARLIGRLRRQRDAAGTH